MKEVFKEEVKRWSPSAKKQFLKECNAIGFVDDNAKGGVCDGTTSNIIDIDDFIVEQRLKDIKR